MSDVTQLELDLLIIFYNFSDQHGKVNVAEAKKWASSKLGLHLPDKPFTLEQRHLDLLMDRGIAPDVRPHLKNSFYTRRPPLQK